MTIEEIKTKTVGELLSLDERIMDILMESGMHCLGCPSAHSESLIEACEIHNLSLDGIVNAIHEVMKDE